MELLGALEGLEETEVRLLLVVASALLTPPGAEELGLGFAFAGLEDDALSDDELGRDMLSAADLLDPVASEVDGNFEVLWTETELSADEEDS